MTQHPPQSDNEILPLPGFHDDTDMFEGKVSSPTRRRSRRRLLIIISSVLLAVVLLGAVFALINARRQRLVFQAQAVTQGDLALTVNGTGPLQSNVYSLNFSGTGKLSEIDVSVGQKVTKDQTLGKLDPTSLQNALNESQATVSAAQTSVSNAQAGLNASLAASQSSVASAQTSLTDAIQNLKDVQTQSQASIDAAQTALSNAQNNLIKVQAQVQAALAVAQDTENQQLAGCNSPTVTNPAACKQAAEDQFAQTQAQQNAQLATAQGAVSTAQKQLSSAQAQANVQNTSAQNQVNTAQKQLDTAQAQANSQNTTAQGQVNSAQSQLNTAQAQLATAQYNVNNTVLKAPHDGVVAAVNGTIGETPGASGSASASASTGTSTASSGGTFVQIVDLSSLQIVASINEIDIGNVVVGDNVQFSVSAYPDQTFTGKVTAISPLGQTVSNVVSYPVYINVDTSSLGTFNLLPGMTASVTIVTDQRTNVLMVPATAISFARTSIIPASTGNIGLIEQSQADNALAAARQMIQDLQSSNPQITKDKPTPAFVLERINNAIVVKPVVIGLTNGTVYEVLDGLTQNDRVLVGVESQAQAQGNPGGAQFRLGGGGGN
ncbi:MAG TPA: HlyD family efflux transporter periplasmic adaptor subunit [Ktedonobacteraceae bacterium]|nr:HlyD family efflux transporter periplasmic adaptor subunit [Ktedonobacteraceae bacterium]